jgi:branched-chain amino acid transport system substrate-binding protein
MTIEASSRDIPIGSMLPLTGPSAIDGAEFRKGIILACEEINLGGGILGRKLRPIFMDTGRQTAEEVVTSAARLIQDHSVHAIINGYNIGSQNSEYEVIADASILYIHHNTLLQHHDTVLSNPDRYFGCFMANPAEFWYGQGFVKFLSWLRETGQWSPANNRIAIISGSKPYSIVIANAMANAAERFGWTVSFGPKILATPRNDWREVIAEAQATDPAVIANTHFYATDLASFQTQFMQHPSNSLVYLQYGAMHKAFVELAQGSAVGVVVSAVTGLLRDEPGNSFASRYILRFGTASTPQIGCQCYNAVRHYAIAASVAGGTGEPGNGSQNRKIARALIDIPFRSVAGMVRYHPQLQAAIPYPDQEQDPSLGMPHLFYQVRDKAAGLALIAPAPYNADRFVLPAWFR